MQEGQLKGIIPDYFAHLMKMAGLPYEVRLAKSRQELEEWTLGNKVDVFMDARLRTEHTPLVDYYGVTTEPYMQLTLARVTQRGFKGKIHRVAVALATVNFAANPLAGLPGAVFSVWHNVSGSMFASYRLKGLEQRGGAVGNDAVVAK